MGRGYKGCGHIVGLVYALFTIMATLKANEGQSYRYPVILRLF